MQSYSFGTTLSFQGKIPIPFRRASLPPSGRRFGFTLIELLTVIAIIGILAAILIPVVSKVRDSARSASCLSNLRQIGLAAHAYADDHNDQFPGYWWWRTSGNVIDGWPGRQGGMWEYVYDGGLLRSNEDSVISCPTAQMVQPVKLAGENNRTYSLNEYAWSYDRNEHPNSRRLSASRRILVKEPTQMALFADGPSRSYHGDRGWYFHTSFRPGLEAYDLPETFFHSDGLNVVFVDGHVENVHRQVFQETGSNHLFWNGGAW